MQAAYVGRFAPSPTGPLHFGSLVAAVASYADARAAQGQWLLRIEDVDRTRCRLSAEAEILHQLAAHGFEHDGEILRQRDRNAVYAASVESLRERGLVFKCNCSRKALQAAPRNAEGETIYPGTCRDAHVKAAAAARLRVDDDAGAKISFIDRARGEIVQNVATSVGDFVLRRADGCFTYQLAVVVDDALQGVTHVVRGADLLLNTPRQIYLQRALQLAAHPSYLHVPLVRNADGEKLSKQTLAEAISTRTPLETLAAAWRFLHQTDVGAHDSVRSFWHAAAAAWDPARLYQPEVSQVF
jgi:glutamyl-Q tRNA(Asp) synthetase